MSPEQKDGRSLLSFWFKSFFAYPIKKKQRDPQGKGFSLIELVIVVGVLAILASIAIPTFQGLILRGRRAAAATYVDAVLKGAILHLSARGRWPNNWDEVFQYSGDQSIQEGDIAVCNFANQPWCNGTQRLILNGQYVVTFYINSLAAPYPNYPNDSPGNMFGISAGRVDHFGPTRENMSVMACATRNRGSQMYMFNEGVYWAGFPWWGTILDNNGDVLRLCG